MNNIIIIIKNLIYQGKARVYEKTLTKSCYRIGDNIKSRNGIEALNWPKKYWEFNNTYNIFNNTLIVNVKTFLGSKKPLFYDFKLNINKLAQNTVRYNSSECVNSIY